MEAYFDNSATTRCYPQVAQIVVKTMTEDFGNPSAMHMVGVKAEKYIKEAQEKAEDILEGMSWKDCGNLAQCVDDSAQIDYEGIILDENQNIVPED